MWGKTMKRFCAAVTAACLLLLSGCGVIQDSKGTGRDVPVSTLNMNDVDSMGSTKKAAVYFLNSEGRTLTADLRLLSVEQDLNPAVSAVKALLLGPSNSSLTRVAPDGVSLDFIEFSNGVANIYLKGSAADMPPDAKYIMEMAIANTVSDILGAAAVSVFYNNLREGFQGYPCAPLKKQTGDVYVAYNNAKANYLPPGETPQDTETPAPAASPHPTAGDEQPSPNETASAGPAPADIATVLYFTAASGDYILPSVRTVKYLPSSPDDKAAYVSAIIDELKKGPNNTNMMNSPLASGVSLIGAPVVTDNGDGTCNVALNFSAPPSDASYEGSKSMLLSYAAIVYSITGFVPFVREVHIFVNGVPAQLDAVNGGTKRSDFFGYIGSSAPLYFQYADSGLLLEVSRSMEQGKIWSALERVRALMRGPQKGDPANINAVKIGDMKEEDILSVKVYNDTAYVNLSEGFKEACADISAQNEMLLVYAIVNTVTAMDGINKVQFLVEGKQTRTLAGHLCLSDPFLKNYGIIKNIG